MSADLLDIADAVTTLEPCISESIELALDLLNADADQMSAEDHQRAVVGILQRLRSAAVKVEYILLRDCIRARTEGKVQP
jgi:hypothetical protein